MNVFVIEGQQGKANVMKTLLCSYDFNNIGFVLENSDVNFYNEAPLYNIGWYMIRNNTVSDIVETITTIASASQAQNIFIYTNYLRNSEIIKNMIKAFKIAGSPLNHAFIFCKPDFE